MPKENVQSAFLMFTLYYDLMEVVTIVSVNDKYAKQF